MLPTFQANPPKHNQESLQGSGAPGHEITDVNISSVKHRVIHVGQVIQLQ